MVCRYFPHRENIPNSSLEEGGTEVVKCRGISVRPLCASVAAWLQQIQRGYLMGERRKARRYEVYLPLQVYTSRKKPAEFHTAQLRDISRTGIYFHSSVALEPGTSVELTFALPTERERASSVLVRASAKALRTTSLLGEETQLFGIAATIDRLDFVRPVSSNAA